MLQATTAKSTPPAATPAAGDWLCSVPGFRLDFDAGIKCDTAEVAPAPSEGKRAGARGKGSKPARARSTAEFSEGFETVRSDRGYAKADRKRKAENRKADEAEAAAACGMTLSEAKARELEQAYREVGRDSERWIAEAAALGLKVRQARLRGLLSPPTSSKHARNLINRVEKAKVFAQLYADDQGAWDRVVRAGYVHKGGMIAGKYYRKKFVEKGLRSWLHPYFQLVVASIGRAGSKNLRTGPTKDACVLRWKKLWALDETYAFFSTVCRDMFRIDIDITFASEAHFRAWIAYIVKEHDLPCGPHIIDWIPDDRFPGEVIHPQLFFLLPEGSAVWPQSDPKQHTMLGQVIAGLTRAFKGDPGGLADPFSGKNPISPTVEAHVYQDTHMPTLDEYFQALDCTLDPVRMFRLLSTEQLETAGFDRADSNTWFTTVANIANCCAQDLYKQGFPIDDRERLQKRLIKAITAPALEAMKPSASQKKAVTALIKSCARYTADSFDPAKMDTKGRDRGAAAHLIEVTDTIKVKQRKGKAYSDTVKIAETRSIITSAIQAELRAGREPTIASITALVPRCYNTVSKHFFACYQTAVASISLGTLLRGSTDFPGLPIPSRAVLMTATSPADLPDSWREAIRDPVLVDHFRLQALRKARKRPKADPAHDIPMPAAGRHVIDFLSAGPVRVFPAKVPVVRAA